MLAPERGRLRRPGRFFAVSAHVAFPREGNMRRNCKREFEKPWWLLTHPPYERPAVDVILISNSLTLQLQCQGDLSTRRVVCTTNRTLPEIGAACRKQRTSA